MRYFFYPSYYYNLYIARMNFLDPKTLAVAYCWDAACIWLTCSWVELST